MHASAGRKIAGAPCSTCELAKRLRGKTTRSRRCQAKSPIGFKYSPSVSYS